MNKAIMFGARIRAKANKVVELEETIEELNKRSVVELEKLDRAETEEEVSAVEKTVDSLQKEVEEKEAEKEQLEKEIDELEKQIEEQNRKAPTPGKTEKRGGKTLEQREAFNHYLRTKEVRADGLKSAEGEAIIPVELMTPKEAKQDKTDLASLVNIVNVKNASGKWAVVKLTDQAMNTVEELEENPELAKPIFTKVNYEIKTRRVHLPVSQELIDDADYDVMGLVAKQAKNQERITKNKDSSISSSPFPTKETVLPFVKAPSQVAQYETPAPKNLFSPFTFLAPIFPKPVAIIMYFVLKFPASVLTILTSS